MIIKTTTNILQNIKNLWKLFEEWNIVIITNKNKVVWTMISSEFYEYLQDNKILKKAEKDFLLWISNNSESWKDFWNYWTRNDFEETIEDSWDSDDFEEFDKQPKKITSKEEAEAIFA